MYKMIIATYGLSLALFLLLIDGYEYIVIAGHYIFFFMLGWMERNRMRGTAWEFGTAVEKKEKRNFASMGH